MNIKKYVLNDFEDECNNSSNFNKVLISCIASLIRDIEKLEFRISNLEKQKNKEV